MTAYPLQWPPGWDRTPSHKRTDGRGKFQKGSWRTGDSRAITLSQAVLGLLDELRLLGASNVIISTNIPLRCDGLPLSGTKPPEDPGVAVYFRFGGDMVMARDEYTRVEDNIRSLALAINGMRQLERHGGGRMLERAFVGFAALPPPDKMTVITTPLPRNWWDILGVSPEAPMAVLWARIGDHVFYREESQ